MAHSLESRVPFINHELIEFVATIPEDIKIKSGKLKYLLKTIFSQEIPSEILNRTDKMGFPVPINDWYTNPEYKYFFNNLLNKLKDRNLEYLLLDNLDINQNTQYSRKMWTLINLELWYEVFFDKHEDFRKLIYS